MQCIENLNIVDGKEHKSEKETKEQGERIMKTTILSKDVIN